MTALLPHAKHLIKDIIIYILGLQGHEQVGASPPYCVTQRDLPTHQTW